MIEQYSLSAIFISSEIEVRNKIINDNEIKNLDNVMFFDIEPNEGENCRDNIIFVYIYNYFIIIYREIL